VAKLTRRSFLQDTSITAATVTAATFSLLPGMPASAVMRHAPEAAAPLLPAPSTGSMVIHVNDIANSEMTFLVGAREVVVRDPELVARLTEAARRAGSPNESHPS
jgi:hypothetical protein